MSAQQESTHSARRLFMAHAAISLVPVVLIGLLLAHSYAGEADKRGLAEGSTQADLIATSVIGPQLNGHDLRSGITATERARLTAVTDQALAAGTVLRLRLRDLDGRVVFSPDGSGLNETPEDEAIDAAHGETIAVRTRFNSDANDTGPVGPDVVEVYRPLTAGPDHTRVGVLEMYLPYAPISDDVSTGMSALYRDLVLGLAALYIVLAGLSFTTTRRLRRHAQVNAYLAEHDQLTGLPNRRAFLQHVQRITSGTSVHLGAVAIVDLDRFKEVNDTLGHDNGDDLLRCIGERLVAAVRPGDVVARIGGDEFGIVLARVVSEAQAAQILGRLREVVAEPIDVTELPLTTESSIGYVLVPEDGDDAQTLLQRADIAMYVAKSSRTGLVRYEPAQDHFDADQLAVVAELHDALINHELEMHFQPKVELPGGEVRAVEALMRWNHPRHGLLQPDSFLPVAEQTGFIDPLTDWALDEALQHMTEWDRRGEPISVAVNVSARNLAHAAFGDRVLAALRSSGIAPGRLILEITETALFTDVEKATGTLARLRAEGVQISLDDFGQGQTSLGFLARLPISEIKIDRVFVTTMCEDSANAAIVRSVVELAHNLGMRVVAEGAESEAVVDALRTMGCDAVQGYVIARPMPASALRNWLVERRLLAVH